MKNKEIEKLLMDMFKYKVAGFDVPWGKIYISELITEMFSPHLEMYRALMNLNQSSSISIGEMQPHAYHRPFIRHIGSETGKPLIIYQVITGNLECVIDREYKVLVPGEFITVKDDELFSFKAGNDGCMFAIMTYPAFEPEQYINEVL